MPALKKNLHISSRTVGLALEQEDHQVPLTGSPDPYESLPLGTARILFKPLRGCGIMPRVNKSALPLAGSYWTEGMDDTAKNLI
jgi:hypothetical protein